MQKKPLWLWNILIGVTIIVCLLAFMAHSKNWTKTDNSKLQILSGFYYQKLRFSELDSVDMIEKIPPMERLNGFSAFDKEKGIFREFKDSLTDKKVFVYVDNLAHQKIKIVHHDSLRLFINLTDSTETQRLYEYLLDQMKVVEK
ncbi:MAG: hypothetical protein HKN31_13130 [Pricia sp.]|nr:hypothetical protein [Pricia sp.]